MVTKEFLDQNPNVIFVFGDNTIRQGMGGAAKLRFHPQSYGFITKILPDNKDSSFYMIENYRDVFHEERHKLSNFIAKNPNKEFYISKLGSGLANKYGIYEHYILSYLKELELLNPEFNIKILWDD